MNKRDVRRTKGFDKRKEAKDKNRDRCPDCGGSLNGDGYWTPKCLCLEMEIMEGDDFAEGDI